MGQEARLLPTHVDGDEELGAGGHEALDKSFTCFPAQAPHPADSGPSWSAIPPSRGRPKVSGPRSECGDSLCSGTKPLGNHHQRCALSGVGILHLLSNLLDADLLLRNEGGLGASRHAGGNAI